MNIFVSRVCLVVVAVLGLVLVNAAVDQHVVGCVNISVRTVLCDSAPSTYNNGFCGGSSSKAACESRGSQGPVNGPFGFNFGVDGMRVVGGTSAVCYITITCEWVRTDLPNGNYYFTCNTKSQETNGYGYSDGWCPEY